MRAVAYGEHLSSHQRGVRNGKDTPARSGCHGKSAIVVLRPVDRRDSEPSRRPIRCTMKRTGRSFISRSSEASWATSTGRCSTRANITCSRNAAPAGPTWTTPACIGDMPSAPIWCIGGSCPWRLCRTRRMVFPARGPRWSTRRTRRAFRPCRRRSCFSTPAPATWRPQPGWCHLPGRQQRRRMHVDEYEKNPVVEAITHYNRDPKVFWHANQPVDHGDHPLLPTLGAGKTAIIGSRSSRLRTKSSGRKRAVSTCPGAWIAPTCSSCLLTAIPTTRVGSSGPVTARTRSAASTAHGSTLPTASTTAADLEGKRLERLRRADL